jgi:hypothetical protein
LLFNWRNKYSVCRLFEMKYFSSFWRLQTAGRACWPKLPAALGEAGKPWR